MNEQCLQGLCQALLRMQRLWRGPPQLYPGWSSGPSLQGSKRPSSGEGQQYGVELEARGSLALKNGSGGTGTEGVRGCRLVSREAAATGAWASGFVNCKGR